jgi:hypothetical protein
LLFSIIGPRKWRLATGNQNTLAWNIHHKTGMSGEAAAYSFSDPTYYLTRLQREIQQYGIQ